MSEVLFLKNLLERDWESSISNRSNDVPEPNLVLEKENRTERLRTQDVGYVASGADTNYTAQGLGWNSQEVETVVVIEYRAATRSTGTGVLDNGYRRLFGDRTGPDGVGAPDRWAGIVGETLRIILDGRIRTAEWDRLGTDSTGSPIRVADNTGLGGANYWRADVFVPMDIVADNIDTST